MRTIKEPLLSKNVQAVIYYSCSIPKPSFIFSNSFLLVRVEVDLDTILGTLDARKEYTLNETSGLMSNLRGNLATHLSERFGEEGGRKPGKYIGNPCIDHSELNIDFTLRSGLNLLL